MADDLVPLTISPVMVDQLKVGMNDWGVHDGNKRERIKLVKQ